MILVAGGDSFIWGTDLADHKHTRQDGHSNSTWPAQLATEYSMEYRCAAWPGLSNNEVARRVLEQCELINDPDNTTVVVQWTFPWRFCYRCADIGWYTFDLQVVTKKFQDAWAEKEIKRLEKIGVLEFAHSFYKSIGSTEYWPVYDTIREILLLQGYLKSKNINYMFTAADNCLFENMTISKPTDVYVRQLYDQIDFNHWVWFPKGTEANETLTPRGFYQWALENKYITGTTGHPLELAHADAKEIIKGKFNELVKKHN